MNQVYKYADLDGKSVCVTGGGGLLGKEFVRSFVEAGACVAVVDKSAALVHEAVAYAGTGVGESAIPLVGDVTDSQSVSGVVETIVGRWGRLDVLVNSAAIDPKFDADVARTNSHRFEDYPLKLWDESLRVNLTGTFLCCQIAGRQMVEQGRGNIINLASTYGVVAPDQGLYQLDGEASQTLFKPAAYPVTKAGIIHLTKYLATYWGSSGVRVNALSPHGVYNSQDEQFTKRFAARSPIGRMARRDEMNGALLFLASDMSSYMTGANLIVDGGWTAW